MRTTFELMITERPWIGLSATEIREIVRIGRHNLDRSQRDPNLSPVEKEVLRLVLEEPIRKAYLELILRN